MMESQVLYLHERLAACCVVAGAFRRNTSEPAANVIGHLPALARDVPNNSFSMAIILELLELDQNIGTRSDETAHSGAHGAPQPAHSRQELPALRLGGRKLKGKT
jgi:hypothetical protein